MLNSSARFAPKLPYFIFEPGSPFIKSNRHGSIVAKTVWSQPHFGTFETPSSRPEMGMPRLSGFGIVDRAFGSNG
jgi:hypothetical protein